jgi:hypothetical protein
MCREPLDGSPHLNGCPYPRKRRTWTLMRVEPGGKYVRMDYWGRIWPATRRDVWRTKAIGRLADVVVWLIKRGRCWRLRWVLMRVVDRW